MSTAITTETKNVVAALTNEAKESPTWDQENTTWDENNGSWNNPGAALVTESKNMTALSNEAKT